MARDARGVTLSFSAYGARRDADWDGPISGTDLTTLGNTTRHGFTDHEHLDSVGLIHMNGRVYDPLIGRFLSRDPYIDGVTSSQGANGYAYVWNNPLSRSDPSGYGGDSSLDLKECDDCLDGGRGARGANTFVSCYGNCATGAGYWNVPTGGSYSWRDYPVSGGVVSWAADSNVEEMVVQSKPSTLVWGSFDTLGQQLGSADYAWRYSGTTAIGPTSSLGTTQAPTSEAASAILSATGIYSSIIENVAKFEGEVRLASKLQVLGPLTSIALAGNSWAQGDTNGAILATAFGVAQVFAIAYGSPFVIAAVTVASVSFAVGQVAGTAGQQ